MAEEKKTVKVCIGCNREQDLSQFYNVTTRYKASRCRGCYNVSRMNRYYEETPTAGLTKIEKNTALRDRCQALLNEGKTISQIGKMYIGASYTLLKKSIQMGILTIPE